MQPTLEELAIKYGADKSSKSHNYAVRYDSYFDKFRNEQIKLLEIGVQYGYSVKMWKEYFPNAEIYGFDLDKECMRFQEERITIIHGNQSNCDLLKATNEQHGPFDIIIDDGSHFNGDMKRTFDCLFPLLKEGGYYIVEDLHCCYWKTMQGWELTGDPVFIDKIKELVDYVNSRGKSGYGNIKLDDPNDTRMGEMTWIDKAIEFMHLYRSIVFIKKY